MWEMIMWKKKVGEQPCGKFVEKHLCGKNRG
jgi:hypothetical protein